MKKLQKPILIKLGLSVTALLVGCIGVLDLGTYKAVASSDGPPSTFSGAPGEASCIQCHTGQPLNSPGGTLSISGLPRTYRPGQEIPVTVTLSHPDAGRLGFQLTSIDSMGRAAGDLLLPSETPQTLQIIPGFVNEIERQYIEHTFDGITPTPPGTRSWTFNWKAPSSLVGKIGFYAAGNAANGTGGSGGDRIYTASTGILAAPARANFDGDVRSDVSVYRPSTGTWYWLDAQGFHAETFGETGDIIVPGDYDGDGITDIAVWRPSTGTWYVRNPAGGFGSFVFGVTGDIPVPGDYDGDGKSDLAVWRPSTGTWYILNAAGFSARQFGVADDLPTQGDFDGDGKTDIAVWRPSTGVWYMIFSSSGDFTGRAFGIGGDQPVQGDYDGDGKTDLAVFRPSNGTWYFQNGAGFSAREFGISGDKPAAADFDGDGKLDIAVYRDGTWYIAGTAGPTFTSTEFGIAGDIPVPRGYIPQ